jgi:hypothetical protein
MSDSNRVEHQAHVDREQAEARDWYADTYAHAPVVLMLLATALADDDSRTLCKLNSKLLDCVQKLAGLKLHELTAHFAETNHIP